ncbi:hypothetical protein EUA69_00485 [TM7 phylum sp. oral taxon 352]|nr:hypothetical protein EUA77_03575 [TM7 phylum sp. oral taxon 351]TWP17153.1 hypothetical protein EUA69_00485 [TM7 phylum sp. oral taxon 352]
MEKPKPAQNHEQERPKTLEDYAVKTFPADLDVTIRPLTVIRSGKDGGGIRDDEGWTPGDMLCVRKEGIGSIELFVKVHKLIKVYGEHVYEECVPITKIVSLKKLQSREENKGFNEFYIQELYGKSTEEMIEEGERAAEQISNSSVVEEGGSDLERPKVSLKIGSMAVEAAGIKKPIDTNKVKANEPVRGPVETDKTGVDSPALKMTKEVLASIGAIKVNDSVGLPAVRAIGIKKPVETDKVGANPADLVATEPVKKPVEVDKASADLVDLPAVESAKNPVVEKSMETNEANTDILPEDFKIAIDSFKQLTEDNNNQFFAKAQYITGELDRLRGLIKYNPTAMNNPAISEMIISTSGRIRDLEASRAESVNKFKNDINSLLEGLKSEIENEDEKRRRLVKLTEHVDQMGVDNTVLGEATSGLLDKLIRIRRYIEGWQNDRWGADGYKSNISQVIGEIVNDLSITSRHRRGIVGDVEVIKREGYYQER